jgi:hypothetical protein
MAEALAYVHAKGVRHCDLKPGNVLLDARGRALLADFGQAHLANDASPALGTFFYMAPEQADLSQQIPDTRWDVYGLGAVFYAMLAGSPPRETDSLKQELGNTQLLSHRLHRYRESIHRARRPDGHRRLPGMDLELVRILDRCLELDPAKRYRDAGQVLDALDRRERKLRQRPMLLFAGLVPLILLMVMTALGLWMLNRSFQKAQKALEAQLWESDRFTAQLVAAVVREKLHDRVAFLTTDAEEEQLKLALAKGNRAQLADLLHIMRKNHKDDFLGTRDNNVFSLCAVVDQNGHILATDVPKISQLINPDMQFRWRDWFNGQGDKADNKEHPWKPIEQTYISQPFVSTVPELGFCVNISTPIRDSGKKPLGLLVGTIKVDDFNCWLTTIQMKDGFAVMLNQRGHCLLHPSEKIKPDPGQAPDNWLENTRYEEHCRLCRDLSIQTTTLDDPVDDPATRGIYYASYAPVRLETLNLLDNRFWHVLIQHEKDRALEPLKRVYRSAIMFGCLAILAVGFLVAIIWLRLPWLLRLLEKKAHA